MFSLFISNRRPLVQPSGFRVSLNYCTNGNDNAPKIISRTPAQLQFLTISVLFPDNEATVCMRCKKSQFTVINRRHHCRNCGAVCCGPCSNKKWLIPTMSSKPVRVCVDCYEKLQKPSENNKPALSSSGEDSEDDDKDNNKTPTAHDGAQFYGDERNNHHHGEK